MSDTDDQLWAMEQLQRMHIWTELERINPSPRDSSYHCVTCELPVWRCACGAA